MGKNPFDEVLDQTSGNPFDEVLDQTSGNPFDAVVAPESGNPFDTATAKAPSNPFDVALSEATQPLISPLLGTAKKLEGIIDELFPKKEQVEPSLRAPSSEPPKPIAIPKPDNKSLGWYTNQKLT
jgi:hypothetical protein